MKNTVESTHSFNINRLLILKRAINSIAGIGNIDIADIKNDVYNLNNKYMAGVSSHIVNYYNAKSQEGGFWAFIKNMNVIGSIESFSKRIRIIISTIDKKHDVTRLLLIINSENNYKIPDYKNTDMTTTCKCDNVIVTTPNEMDCVCPKCGITIILYGSCIDESVLSGNYYNKAKYPRHHPNKHCKLWIGRIQAWNGPEINQAVFDKISECIKRDNVNTKKIKCNQMRMYLKECKLTKYNNFVPYIRKIITGTSPPQLGTAELNELYFLFNKISSTLKKTCPERNISYYPFFIYKILDFILLDGVRKSRILECIHLQSVHTINIADGIYKSICEEINDITYKPTNKREHAFLL
jgi:hypothetical protein